MFFRGNPPRPVEVPFIFWTSEFATRHLSNFSGLEKNALERLGRLSCGERNSVDGRYIFRGKQPASEARERVYDFLNELYLESAEFIPDGLNSNKRPRQAGYKLDSKNLDSSAIKHLPPGSINEYYQLCKAANPGVKISRKLWASVTWKLELRDVLAIIIVWRGTAISLIFPAN